MYICIYVYTYVETETDSIVLASTLSIWLCSKGGADVSLLPLNQTK